MTAVPRIFLVGLMGAGKSTIGRLLAREFGLHFVDSDHEIEARNGVSIATIFEVEGESGFRARERRVIDELTQREGIVLATGGGAVIDADNRRDLAARGLVIYLAPRRRACSCACATTVRGPCCRTPTRAPDWSSSTFSATPGIARWPTSRSRPGARVPASCAREIASRVRASEPGLTAAEAQACGR
jgi:shikimate kinase